MQRMYYDHEPAYQRIRAAGGRGWDDLNPATANGSYVALDAFIRSPFFPDLCRAIDLGCGGGQGALKLAQAGARVLGIDFAPTAIELALANSRAAGQEIDFFVGDCLNMSSLPAETLDLAVDNHTLHCLVTKQDRHRFLSEVHRVLRPGGILFSETMSAEGLPDFCELGVDPSTRIDRHHTRYWVTRIELEHELAEGRFTVLSIRLRPQPEQPNHGDTIATVSRRI